MASWMVHLRVAEKVFEKLRMWDCDLREKGSSAGEEGTSLEEGRTWCETGTDRKWCETEYIVGNIAPDSGIPSEDWTTFTPSTWVSHFSTLDENGLKKVDVDRFEREYLTAKQVEKYTQKQFSFYIGYYNHLLTDMLWAEYVVNPLRMCDRENFETDRTGTVWKWKKDWYDLDFLYLKKHPDFHTFHVYKEAAGFVNEYMDFFAQDAFDNRREYITGFYLAGREGLEREYPWLTEEEMDAFVDMAAAKIMEKNKEVLAGEQAGNL